MEKNSLDDKIQIKNKEIQIEKDSNRKLELNNDLEILNWRKQIELLKIRIKSKMQYK